MPRKHYLGVASNIPILGFTIANHSCISGQTNDIFSHVK